MANFRAGGGGGVETPLLKVPPGNPYLNFLIHIIKFMY